MVWLVSGEATTESGTGGEEQWLYITEEALSLPDIRNTFFAGQSTNGRSWYLIESIKRVGVSEMRQLLNNGVGIAWSHPRE